MEEPTLQQIGHASRTALPSGKLLVQILLVAVLYFLAGRASFSLSVSHGIVTEVVFLAEGIALSAAILCGPRIWPGIFLGQLLLALSNDLAWPLALGVSAINSIEALLGAALFQRLKIRSAYDRLRDVGLLLTLIFLVLQPFSATLGTSLLWFGDVIDTPSLQSAWLAWWFGNALGQTIVVPLLLTLSLPGFNVQRVTHQMLPSLLLALLIGWLVFPGPQFGGVSIALAAPLMVLLAACYGMAATALGSAVIVGMALYYTRMGLGPFAGDIDNLLELNFFLLGIALTGQFVAALFAKRKFVEQELQLIRERLQEAQRSASVGSWTNDLRSNRLEWSDEFFRIFEFDPAHFAASYETFMNTVHPEDREKVGKAYTDSVINRTPYEIIHRLLFADGRIKHVRGRGETVYGADGTPLQSHGTLLDITGIRQAEESLLLYWKIFDKSGEAIVVTDHNNDIITINQAFTKLTGYSIEEVLGENPRMLASGHTPPETYAALWQNLNESGMWQGELWDRRKDGSIYPKWATISVIRDAAGRVVNYFASFVDIAERKAAEERMHRLAHHDALTGLLNRFSLEIRLEQALRASQRESKQLAVMFLDMDRFKNINDTLGHHVGDMLLVEVATRLQACARASDIVARLGGDEFVVVLTGDVDNTAATNVADKIVARLSQPYQIDQNNLHSSSSIGISLFPEHGTDVDSLMRHADIAMYHAKEQGRNKFKFFISSMTTATIERRAMEEDLREALAQGKFELHYQPQVSSEDNRIFRVEALARWRHSEHGLVPPLHFIPIIEEIGLSDAFSAWVLDQACLQLALWRAKGIASVRMAVNLSATQLRSSKLFHLVRETMSRHGIRPGELELELDEAVIMNNPERLIEQLRTLHSIGVKLSVSNFGAGFSSLIYLKLLPIQTLKLSRAFVSGIESDANSAAIIAAILMLARSLGLQVVAEGVETEQQRAFLASHQCDLLQGYLVSHPLPIEEATCFISMH